ncbi:MAG: hypothetical protein ACNA70_05450 [Brevefilum sp.]
MNNKLEKRQVRGGQVAGSLTEGYLLDLPPLPGGRYGLAQLDDYMHLPRRKFPHPKPLKVMLEARVSAPELPGTWGFGLWNDPFSFGFGGGGMARALPVLPNAAWFFYGSGENHLTLQEGQPGAGLQAKTFRSPLLPPLASLFALPALLFLIWPRLARMLRRLARMVVKEDAVALNVTVDAWHAYGLEWTENKVLFEVDGEVVLETPVSPLGRLGLVMWIDNQFFRFDPSGRIGFGILEVPQGGWLQVRHLVVGKPM